MESQPILKFGLADNETHSLTRSFMELQDLPTTRESHNLRLLDEMLGWSGSDNVEAIKRGIAASSHWATRLAKSVSNEMWLK